MDAKHNLYIHIGAPKTGTTFLQKVLFENRDRLAASNGVLYPEVNLRGYGHHDLAYLLSGGYPAYAKAQPRSLAELEGDLHRAAAGHNGPMLLSSENFFLYPAPQALRRVLEVCGVLDRFIPVIVVYLRRQDLAHESWYNQRVKAQGETRQFAACVWAYRDLWDYDARLAQWEEVFGKDAVRARIYDEAWPGNGGLLPDFLDAVDMPGVLHSPASTTVNTNLNRDLLAFQRLVNGLPLSHQKKRAYHHSMIALTGSCKGSSLFDETPLLDHHFAQEIRASYEAGNTAVARRYFARDRLFVEPDRNALPEHTPVSELTVDKMAMIMAWLLASDDKA